MAKEFMRPDYRSNVEHRASAKAFGDLPLLVQRRTDFRSFDTGFHCARGVVEHVEEREKEAMWRSIVKKSERALTKPLIQQLAESVGLSTDYVSWTRTGCNAMVAELCAYLDEQLKPTILFDKTALAELREVPSATSANAEACRDCGLPTRSGGIGGLENSCWKGRGVEGDKFCAERAVSRLRSALAASEARVQELTGELAWEKAWDLHRKADMQAIVEAARIVYTWLVDDSDKRPKDEVTPILGRALSALDARIEPVGKREIVVGSVWKGPLRWSRVVAVNGLMTVTVRGHNHGDTEHAIHWDRREFLAKHEWVSDPAPPISESAPREG